MATKIDVMTTLCSAFGVFSAFGVAIVAVFPVNHIRRDLQRVPARLRALRVLPVGGLEGRVGREHDVEDQAGRAVHGDRVRVPGTLPDSALSLPIISVAVCSQHSSYSARAAGEVSIQ